MRQVPTNNNVLPFRGPTYFPAVRLGLGNSCPLSFKGIIFPKSQFGTQKRRGWKNRNGYTPHSPLLPHQRDKLRVAMRASHGYSEKGILPSWPQPQVKSRRKTSNLNPHNMVKLSGPGFISYKREGWLSRHTKKVSQKFCTAESNFV